MKKPTKLLNLVLAVVVLSACGGNGDTSVGNASSTSIAGSGSNSSNSGTLTLTQVTVPTGFTWQTVAGGGAGNVKLSRTTAATLGGVRVVLSNFIDKDPTGSGAAIDPISTDVIATALAQNANGPSATASFGTLRFPSGTSSVLIEVFDADQGSRLAYVKVDVSTLLADGLTIGL